MCTSRPLGLYLILGFDLWSVLGLGSGIELRLGLGLEWLRYYFLYQYIFPRLDVLNLIICNLYRQNINMAVTSAHGVYYTG